MGQILEDVRKDAEKKLRSSEQEDIQPLYDSIANVLQLCRVAHKYGGAILDEVILKGETKYVETLLLLMARKADPDYIIEVGTNEYWVQDIQGIWAMVYYIYLQGALAVCRRENIWGIGELIDALIPEGYPPIWDSLNRCPVEEIEINIIPPQKVEELKLGIEKSKKRELLRDNQLMEEFLMFRPVFQDSKLIKKLHELEKNIAILSDQSIGEIIKHVKYCVKIYCLYGLCNEARVKILNSISYGDDRQTSYYKNENIKETMKIGECSEEEILGAVLIMLSQIKSFQKSGEI